MNEVNKMNEIRYSPAERFALIGLAVVGMVGVNGVYLYNLLLRPTVLAEAMANPVALAFMGEAFLLLIALAYLLRKWGVLRIGWGWFIVLSILGSIAFALPVSLLWPRKRGADRRPSRESNEARR